MKVHHYFKVLNFLQHFLLLSTAIVEYSPAAIQGFQGEAEKG
jgi:hypothetical protein